jgi:hypothetical protein
MNGIEKFAKLFIERNNPYHINIDIADVVSTSPLRIKYGDSIILQSDKLILNNILKDGFTVEYTDTSDSGTATKQITIKDSLQIGDKVMIVPDNDFKLWYVISKAVIG